MTLLLVGTTFYYRMSYEVEKEAYGNIEEITNQTVDLGNLSWQECDLLERPIGGCFDGSMRA
ncbi:MAG TPA: hypothetical protein VF260_09040 [Bacilli bacterium]